DLGRRQALIEQHLQFGPVLAGLAQLAYTPFSETRKDRAGLVVLLYQGLAPTKVSTSLTQPIVLMDGTQQYFRMDLPKAEVMEPPDPQASLAASSGATAPFELFQDINAIAVRDLQDKAAALIVKATARALIKF